MHGKMPTEKWVDYLRDTFKTMWHTPIAFITGETGKNLKTLINHAQMLFKQSRQRVPTGQLNRLVGRAIDHFEPPMHRGKRPRIYYATQVSTEPPTIVLVCNNPSGFRQPYRRYLLGVFRDQLSFGEVPMKLYLHRRRRDDPRDEIETKSSVASGTTSEPG
jgi:GTP-binding protein